MDRRTVLAFALIFLVYIAWSQVYKSLYGGGGDDVAPADSLVAAGEVAGEAATAPEERAGAVAETGAARDEPVPAEMPGPAFPGEDALGFQDPGGAPRAVSVRTPLYELEISTLGGRIVSWRGLDFEHPDGGPVELVPADFAAGAAGGDAVIFRRDALDLSRAVFAVEGAEEVRVSAGGGPASVVLRAETAGGLTVRKTFTFHPDRYDITLDQELVPRDAAAVAPLLGLLGDPVRARFGWAQGIASTEGDPRLEEPAFRSFAMVGEEIAFKKRSGLSKSRDKVRQEFEGSVRFAGLQNKYFCVTGFPPAAAGAAVEGRIGLDGDTERGQQSWWIEVPLRRPEVGGDAMAAARLQLYLGPCEYDLLKSYGQDLEKSVDLGWKLFRPLSELVLVFMLWLYKWIPNYGVIIIILSVLTKIMFYPLTRKSTESMRRMQAVQPKLKALQEKYKDNREKLSQETMKLYRDEKVNPMAGCLPLLVQSPVFIALYQVLRQTIALRQAPFALWMQDLAAPDALFKLPFSLPLLGDNFNLLPILMALSMYFQTKLTPTAGAGGQMAAINAMMPLMMLVFFYNMPSGLVLYWLINTVMTIYQTWKIHRTAPATGGAH